MKTLYALIILAVMLSLSASAQYVPDPWARQIVAATLVLEASCQDTIGMVAVASVIQNRAYSRPSQIYSVVKTPYAFSALNGGNYARCVREASRDRNWPMALTITDMLYKGKLQDVTFGATHYLPVYLDTSWSRSMAVTRIIGDHKFLRRR
jgi:spore germination cell wall hydrolase CwlJ-like protein